MSSLEAVVGSFESSEEQRAAERRIESLLALNRAALAITGELELDSLLQMIVDVARELVGCKYAALGVLGEDGYIERFPTSGVSKEEREKIGAPPRGHGLLGVMLRAGRSLRVPEISKDPRRVGFPPHHPPMTSLLGVPIFVRGRLAGDLYLTEKDGGPEFSEEDEWLVQLLATHAATALTNAELHAEKVRANNSLRSLLRVTQAINRSVHLDRVLPVIVQSTMELLGASGAAVYLLEKSHIPARVPSGMENRGQFVTARYGVGLKGGRRGRRITVSVEGTVAGRAIRTGRTQVINDLSREPDKVLAQLTGAKTLASLAVVPLRVGDEILGVLSAYSERKSAFDPEAVELMQAFGAQASAALYNAQLYEIAQRGREAAELEQQRMRELEQMKDEFLSTAAHELRTPLTSIRMSAGLAQEQLQHLVDQGVIDPRLADLMGLVAEGSQRMQSLVNDLLDLTRLEQGRTSLATENLDMREVVRESVATTEALFESKGQKLAVHLPETYCGVKGDRQRLEQLVINLLSNAHKYSPPGSQVEVRAVRSVDEVKVSVRDNGPGVPPEERERIFERFVRSSLHRNDRTASTGLGLPIARTIAEMHRGRLWIDPAPGGGSIFTLVLPVAGEPRTV
jgi:signal transduction histidine kinase